VLFGSRDRGSVFVCGLRLDAALPNTLGENMMFLCVKRNAARYRVLRSSEALQGIHVLG